MNNFSKITPLPLRSSAGKSLQFLIEISSRFSCQQPGRWLRQELCFRGGGPGISNWRPSRSPSSSFCLSLSPGFSPALRCSRKEIVFFFPHLHTTNAIEQSAQRTYIYTIMYIHMYMCVCVCVHSVVLMQIVVLHSKCNGLFPFYVVYKKRSKFCIRNRMQWRELGKIPLRSIQNAFVFANFIEIYTYLKYGVHRSTRCIQIKIQ